MLITVEELEEKEGEEWQKVIAIRVVIQKALNELLQKIVDMCVEMILREFCSPEQYHLDAFGHYVFPYE